MKKFLLAILLSSLSLTQALSQGNFAPVGTTWHYNVYDWLFLTDSPVILQSTDTVTVGGILCNKISIIDNGSCAPFSDCYVYESNDSVYIYVSSTNSFSVLYNFNALPGDSIAITCETSGTTSQFTMVVDSLGTINVNGNIRKLIYWHWPQIWSGLGPLQFFGPVIEGLGDSRFLFPQIAVCDPQAYGMRCYYDSLVGLYLTGLTPTCDTVITVGMDKLSSTAFKVYPNPCINTVEISLPETFWDATIFISDLSGRVYFKKENFNDKEYKLDASILSAGIYLLHISDGYNSYVTKLAKM